VIEGGEEGGRESDRREVHDDQLRILASLANKNIELRGDLSDAYRG
jgi:hypothetical protein